MADVADRVRETTTTTGTGNITLAGADTGYVTFNSAFGQQVRFAYCIRGVDNSLNDSGEWEVGIGYLSASTTLVRDRVLRSSNANAAVNFSAGTKQAFCTYAADEAMSLAVAVANQANMFLNTT